MLNFKLNTALSKQLDNNLIKLKSKISITYKIIIALIICVTTSSCAIHMKWPFICFKKKCIVQYYKIREIKHATKNILAVNKSNRYKKRTKNRRETDKGDYIGKRIKLNNEIVVGEDSITSLKKDSVLSLSFDRSRNLDTLIILKQFTEDNSILMSDKEFLAAFFIRIHNKDRKSIIIIQETTDDRYRRYSLRLKRLKEYLIFLNINAEIFIERNIQPTENNHRNKIEIKVS